MTQLELPELIASELAADEVADRVKKKESAPEVRLDGGTQPRECTTSQRVNAVE